MKSFIALLFLLVPTTIFGLAPTTQPEIDWKPYSEDVFAQAKQQHKLITP